MRKMTKGVWLFVIVMLVTIGYTDKGKVNRVFAEEETNLLTEKPDETGKDETASIIISIGNIDIRKIDYLEEVFPVLCEKWSDIMEGGFFEIELKNNGDKSETVTVTAEVQEWSNLAATTITLQPNETKTVSLTPSFKDKIMENTEVRSASVFFTIKKGNDIVYQDTKNIRILAAGDMLWEIENPFDTSSLIAAWVTPRDPVIEKVLAIAKEKMPERSLSGKLQEVEALYNTLKCIGISYVNSTVSFSKGFSQRVRFPRESIRNKSANCIDGVVLFASLFENLNMKPYIVIKPGHAFVGVETEDSEGVLAIETTSLGTSTFEEAIQGAEEEFQEVLDEFKKYWDAENESAAEGILKELNAKRYDLIDISEVRKDGITPLSPKGEILEVKCGEEETTEKTESVNAIEDEEGEE